MDVAIEDSWKQNLDSIFQTNQFKELSAAVKKEYQSGVVYPAPQNIFRAFDLIPFDKVKVVIIGQDPYHTPGVADGLAFSTLPGNKTPPSLKNIYKEIQQEYQLESYENQQNPDLTRWAEQGVLLLNNTLTVRKSQANSHKELGWNIFTDQVIQILAQERNHLVFMLWGKFAQSKKVLIEDDSMFGATQEHLILESAHPSPFSAANGFFGNGHFKKANEWLESYGDTKIDWS